MSVDGAHMGVGAHAALTAILGGEQPDHVETAGEMKSRILAMTIEQATGYDEAATYIAKVVLLAMMGDPALAQLPIDDEYALGDDGRMLWVDGKAIVSKQGLYSTMKPNLSPADAKLFDGMTGFMWGWACNAARRCAELPPVANPAIVTIGGES